MSSVILAAKGPMRVGAWPVLPAMVAVFVVGAGLRIAGATGSLWFDEIWSLQNLEGLTGPGEIFWGISQDNNHFLNSLWLWAAGPNSSPLVLRSLSIAFGLGSIWMATRIVVRETGPLGAFVAAVFFAASPILVEYGSEARGYSGMIFGLLWAYDALSRLLDDPANDRPRLELMAAVVLGSLSQITALPAVGALVGAAIFVYAQTASDWRAVCALAGRLGSAFILGAAPVCLAVAAGVMNTGIIRFGDQTPFSLAGWLRGLDGMASATVGLPGNITPLAVITAMVLTLCFLPLVALRTRIMTGALIFLLPLAEAAARIPNLHIPRFHLPCAIGLLLLCAAALSHLWRGDANLRRLTVALTSLFLIGASFQLGPFLMLGRGAFADAVRTIGNRTYATDAETIVRRTLGYYAPRENTKPVALAKGDCSVAPDWYIRVQDNRDGNPPLALPGEGAPCGKSFALVQTYPYAGLSGFRWSLYRRDGG